MNDYNVALGADGKIFVLLHRNCKISQGEISALLRESGLDISQVTFLELDQLAGCADLKGVPIIIPIGEETCDLPEIDDAGRACGQAGGRVVVLFGPGFAYDGLHPTADKYGTQCGWSSDQLKGCIVGAADAPRAGSGALVKRSTAGQVNC